MTHIWYADDMTLMANSLRWFILIHLVQMCLSSTLREFRLHTKYNLKYLGMMFYRRVSMIESSKHAASPFMASAFRVSQFLCENFLVNRPYVA